jgi:hypothetical protein
MNVLYVYDIPFLAAPEGCVRVRGLDELRSLYCKDGVRIRDLEPIVMVPRRRVRIRKAA